MCSTETKEIAHLDEPVRGFDRGDSLELELLGMLCLTAKKSRAMLFAAAVLLGLGTASVSAGEKPTPYELGRYIGWLVSCGAIQGSQDEVSRALRRSIERYNRWEYSQSDIATLIKSVRFGMMGRLKYDDGEQVCAKIISNKQSVEWANQLVEFGR